MATVTRLPNLEPGGQSGSDRHSEILRTEIDFPDRPRKRNVRDLDLGAAHHLTRQPDIGDRGQPDAAPFLDRVLFQVARERGKLRSKGGGRMIQGDRFAK